jgi:CRISPR-associated protein Csx3
MKQASALNPPPDAGGPAAFSRVVRRDLAGAAGFGLLELRAGSPLVIELLPGGGVFALRHEETMLNQLLPGPAEDGLFRLLLRWRGPGVRTGATSLVGSGLAFGRTGPAGAAWSCRPAPGLSCETQLQLHPVHAAWAWRVRLRNDSPRAFSVDVLHAQDLGLADTGAVRNNEAYTSHYIDLLPVDSEPLGWTVLARQNEAMTGGRHPWLATGCATGAAACCTDAWQFFGADHRLTGEPEAVRAAALPSRRLQYESALAGLQSRSLELGPGAAGEIVFLARFEPDHPAASGPGDLALLQALWPLDWLPPFPSVPTAALAPSLYVRAGWQHGRSPKAADWSDWFPGERRHEERDDRGALLSFFHGEDSHVVSREKEAAVARPHGHVLRSGGALWAGAEQLGVTCYAAGIFGAQAYLGNPTFARLTSVVRNALNVARAHGQRVFVRRDGEWRQLGVPSAFVMTPGGARWIYGIEGGVVEARVWCAAGQPAAILELTVAAGGPVEFLVAHQLVLGTTEFEHPVTLEFHTDGGWVACLPSASGLMGRHLPGACFAVAAVAPDDFVRVAGDGPLYADGRDRGGPYLTLQSHPVRQCAVALIGSHAGGETLAAAVAAARAAWNAGAAPARPPAAPVRLSGGNHPGVARIEEILPWFTHNAWIHFSAPHGLEQYGGAAWGVRDVCQGSVEWLLAAGEFATARRLMATVFAQQYPDGSWPQWFMHPPFHFIQQAHSHGDVCFWPVKALCDYVEASGDIAFLTHACGYTDTMRFEPCAPVEPLFAHCDRVVAHCESRFLPGTALVNYGDGDWDDTLQPADPAMRTRMVSSWTVGLAFHTFRQLANVYRRGGDGVRASRLEALLVRMRTDFAGLLEPGGVVAGFLVREDTGDRVLLHPRDDITGIRYRLLPMTRSVLAELFAPDEARRHLALVRDELLYPDGVRLMSAPAQYHGGREQWFKRAETAANVGREIGLQYVHAHLRYLEALAKTGDADALWHGFQVVNPVDLASLLPSALPRQANTYFSSSDADFADRYEAERRWPELRTGGVGVRGGWRLYSSGPGLFIHKIRTCLLGVRESFGDVVFDPVLARPLNGLRARLRLCGHEVELHYQVRHGTSGPRGLRVNGAVLDCWTREANPYREGGLRVRGADLAARWRDGVNEIEIQL